MMVDRRRGVLLAREAVRKFAVGTVLDWRNKVMEGFSIRNVPQLRGAMGCRGDAGANHRLHLVLQHALRSAIVIEVEHAAMDEARTVVGEEAFWKVVWPLAGQWLPPIRLPALSSVSHHVKQSTITPAQRTLDGGDGGRRGETVDP